MESKITMEIENIKKTVETLEVLLAQRKARLEETKNWPNVSSREEAEYDVKAVERTITLLKMKLAFFNK